MAEIYKLVMDGGSIWVGRTKITFDCQVGVTTDGPDECWPGDLVTDDHEFRNRPLGPYTLQERFDVVENVTGLDAILWESMTDEPFEEMHEAVQEAEFAVTEGRTVRVIDRDGTVVCEPGTECKTCGGFGGFDCSKCGGEGGSGPLLCDVCKGDGDVPCPDCSEVDE